MLIPSIVKLVNSRIEPPSGRSGVGCAMYGQIEDFFNWRGSLFDGNRHDDLAGTYVYPMAIYHGDIRVIVNTVEQP